MDKLSPIERDLTEIASCAVWILTIGVILHEEIRERYKLSGRTSILAGIICALIGCVIAVYFLHILKRL